MAEIIKSAENLVKKVILKTYVHLHKVSRKNFQFSVTKESKILLIRLNRVGDALVTTPFIHLLKQKTGAQIYILADRRNHFVFRHNPEISDVFIYEKKPPKSGEQLKKLREMNFDAVVDLHDDVSNTVTTIVGGMNCKVKAGLEKTTSPVYTHTVPRKNPEVTHIIERLAELGSIFGFQPDAKELQIQMYISGEADRRMHEKIQPLLESGKLITAVNISAGSKARFWGTDRFLKLIQFLKTQETEYIILADPKDLHHTEEIFNEAGRVFAPPSFEELAAILQYSDILFSPDTAPVHLASMFRKPVFGLYVHFNTKDVIWFPYNCDYEVVLTKEPNLDNVSFDEVIKKFKPFLEKYIHAKRSSIL
ncbi:MAG: hypothetical protein AMXMBFR48_15700 [Ignavibacteriales bacterium]